MTLGVCTKTWSQAVSKKWVCVKKQKKKKKLKEIKKKRKKKPGMYRGADHEDLHEVQPQTVQKLLTNSKEKTHMLKWTQQKCTIELKMWKNKILKFVFFDKKHST